MNQKALYENPDWRPIEAAMHRLGRPVADVGHFMWMNRSYHHGSKPDTLATEVQHYKHRDTRRYLLLTVYAGELLAYSHRTGHQIPLAQAMQEVE
jgi:hypothetical protein